MRTLHAATFAHNRQPVTVKVIPVLYKFYQVNLSVEKGSKSAVGSFSQVPFFLGVVRIKFNCV